MTPPKQGAALALSLRVYKSVVGMHIMANVAGHCLSVLIRVEVCERNFYHCTDVNRKGRALLGYSNNLQLDIHFSQTYFLAYLHVGGY